MAIIARKCLLSISWLETSALQGVNINKLSWGLQHTSAKSCRFSGVTAHTLWFADKMGSCVFRRVSQKTYRLSFIDLVSSYLLSSCRLWSISSACSICIDFACLCPRCIVCWIWEKKKNALWLWDLDIFLMYWKFLHSGLLDGKKKKHNL